MRLINNPHINKLRPYQREVALAILNSVFGRKGLKEAIGNVLRDVALPLGIGIGTIIKK